MVYHQNHPWPAWAIRAMYEGEKQRMYQAFAELEFASFETLLLENIHRSSLGQFSGTEPLLHSPFAPRNAPFSKTLADPVQLQILDFVVWDDRRYIIERLYTETVWLLPLDHVADASVYNDVRAVARDVES